MSVVNHVAERAPGLSPSRLVGLTMPGSLSTFSAERPMIVCHRLGRFVAPEFSVGAAEQCAANPDIGAFEADIHLTSDGVAVLSHDSTVDANTHGTGSISGMTAQQFLRLQNSNEVRAAIDSGLAMMTLDHMIQRYKNLVFLAIEAKVTAAVPVIVQALVNAGVSRDFAMVTSFTMSALAPATAAGYPTEFLSTTQHTPAQIAAAKAAGITHLGVSKDRSVAQIQALVAEGFGINVFTVNKRWQRDEIKAAGATAIYSNDPAYLAVDYAIRTTDNFRSKTWRPGMQSADMITSEVGDAGTRGYFDRDGWGFQTPATEFKTYVSQGEMCPIKNDPGADDYTIEFDVEFLGRTLATRWVAVAINGEATLDRQFNDVGAIDENAYNLLFGPDGRMRIFKRVDGALVGGQLAIATGAPIADGETVRFQAVMTPAAVTLNRLDSAGAVTDTCTANDTSHRGGYFFFGKFGVAAIFKNVVIT